MCQRYWMTPAAALLCFSFEKKTHHHTQCSNLATNEDSSDQWQLTRIQSRPKTTMWLVHPW